MALRDAGVTTTPDGDDVEQAITRQIALLWQTRVLRRERLYVTDEVETALSLSARRVPAGAARPLPALGPRAGRARAELPAPRQLDRRRPRRQSQCRGGVADHGARQVVRGGARLLSRRGPRARRRTVDLDRACARSATICSRWPRASGDTAASRDDEPYRRALSGIYARLAATHLALTGKPAPRPGSLTGEPVQQSAGVAPRPGDDRARAGARRTGRYRRAARSGG